MICACVCQREITRERECVCVCLLCFLSLVFSVRLSPTAMVSHSAAFVRLFDLARKLLVFKLLFIHLLFCFPQPSEEVKAAAQTLYIQKYARTHTHTHTYTLQGT